MYRKQVRRRRAVLLLLVAASLTLLSLYYREGNAGPLHGAEKVVSTVTAPIQDIANRALKPARDLVNRFHETFDARGQNSQLKDEVANLRSQLAKDQTTQAEAKELASLNQTLSGGIVPAGTDPVTIQRTRRRLTVPARRCTPAPIGRITTAATRSDEIAADGLMPNSRINMGVISAPPPAPVMPTSNPTIALPRTT